MKQRQSQFAGVARIIAKGDPPEWLVLGLEHFSGDLGVDISKKDRIFANTQVERMQDAVHVLMRGLRIFEHFPFGAQCPEDVTVVLDALPRIKKDLDRLGRKKIGRKPDVGREICAAVVAEAWKLLHGRAKPRSDEFLGACQDYWRACGGKPRGKEDDLENWRRDVEKALKTDHSWVGEVLLAVQNSH